MTRFFHLDELDFDDKKFGGYARSRHEEVSQLLYQAN